MKRLILIFVLGSCIFIVGATEIWPDESTSIESFKEVVRVYENDIIVTDTINLLIPKEKKDNWISLSIEPSYKNLGDRGIGHKGYEIVLCQPGNNTQLNYYVSDALGVTCSGDEFKNLIEQNLSKYNLTINIQFRASELNWNEYLTESGDKKIYISTKYILKNFVSDIDNYKTLWIKTIHCNPNFPECLNITPSRYVFFPINQFIEGGYNQQVFSISDSYQTFIPKNPKEDLTFIYKDVIKEKNKNLARDLYLILISLGIVSLFSVLQLYLHKDNVWNNLGWVIFGIGCLLLGFGGLNSSIFLIVLGCILFVMGGIIYSSTWRKNEDKLKKLEELLSHPELLKGFGKKDC